MDGSGEERRRVTADGRLSEAQPRPQPELAVCEAWADAGSG